MREFYVVYGEGSYLKDYGPYYTVWTSQKDEALKYRTQAEADVVAYAVEASVECNTTEPCAS